MSLAYRCGTCEQRPWWTIERIGDAVVIWVCNDHLIPVCHGLQREWERTELLVRRTERKS